MIESSIIAPRINAFQMAAIQTEIGLGACRAMALNPSPVPTEEGMNTTAMMMMPRTNSALLSAALTSPAKAPLNTRTAQSVDQAARTYEATRNFLRFGVVRAWAVGAHTGHRWRLSGKEKSHVAQEPAPQSWQVATGAVFGCWMQPAPRGRLTATVSSCGKGGGSAILSTGFSSTVAGVFRHSRQEMVPSGIV